MRTRHPVGRSSQAGSTSSVQYQLAVNRTRSTSPANPMRMLRCAPDRSGGQLPRGERRRLPGGRRLPDALPAVDDVARRLRELLQRRPELPHQDTPPAARRRTRARRPKPICWNSKCGESRRERLAYSSMVTESTRRCSDSSAYGSASLMKPGLLPVAKIDEPPRRQASTNPLAVVGRELAPAAEDLAAGGDDVGARLEQRHDVIDRRRRAACRARSRPEAP